MVSMNERVIFTTSYFSSIEKEYMMIMKRSMLHKIRMILKGMQRNVMEL